MSAPPPQPQPEPEKQAEKVTHLVIMTGGLDSSVLLMLVKQIIPPEAELKIIESGDRQYIDPILEKAGVDKGKSVYAAPEGFDMSKATEWDDQKWSSLFKKLKEDKINVIHIPANYEEGLNNIPGSNFDFWQRVQTIASESGISISMPLRVVTKHAIILMAIDDYGLDLSKLAPPKTGDAEQDKLYQKIRDEAFKGAYSTKTGKYIKDPFSKEAKDKTAQEAQGQTPPPAVATTAPPPTQSAAA